MTVRDLTAGRIVPGVIAGLLAGCGGGGGYGGSSMGSTGGGYGNNPMPNPMPTVKFTSPMQATSINFGQAVQLAWTSSNATSCSASTSSSVGGAFSGSQPMSGNATVAPTGTGSVTYTVTCTGAGGTASATTAAVTVNPSILSTLSVTKIATIGPTLDPATNKNGGNPYGLVIAPETSGLITKGDLIVCNFNSGALGTQGSGTTIVGLHPTVGSSPQTPYMIANNPALTGCNALTMLPDDTISAAALTGTPPGTSGGQNPLVTATGTVSDPFGAAGDKFAAPWGEAYVAANGQIPAAIYVSNVDGSIDRIALNGDAQTSFTKIVTGFCGSGKPGAIYGPSGLTYDPSIDTLYVVDTSSNTVVALAKVSAIASGGVVINGQCTNSPPTPTPTFSGPSASSARVIAHGSPFIAPISAALLPDGNLIVGNGDLDLQSGQMMNLLVEVSPNLPGGFVGQPVQVDTVAPAALFGIVATVDAQNNPIIYFNDDNSNSVMVLTK